MSGASLGDLCCRCAEDVTELFAFSVGLEKQLADLKEVAQYLMDIYVPQEEGAEPKELVDRLDEAEGQMKTLLLDTNKIFVAAALATVKFHEPSFDLKKVAEDVDLAELVSGEDFQVTVEEVIKKFGLWNPRLRLYQCVS